MWQEPLFSPESQQTSSLIIDISQRQRQIADSVVTPHSIRSWEATTGGPAEGCRVANNSGSGKPVDSARLRGATAALQVDLGWLGGASLVGSAAAVAFLQLTDDLAHNLDRLAADIDGDRVLVRRRLLKSRELAIEQGCGHEVLVPCGQSPADEIV